MKVKTKITADQFCYLIYFLQASTYEGLSELQVLNIRLLIKIGLKKIVDLKTDGIYMPEKLKTFNIEINQYCALMACLTHYRNYLDPFTLSIYLTLQNQNKPLIQLS